MVLSTLKKTNRMIVEQNQKAEQYTVCYKDAEAEWFRCREIVGSGHGAEQFEITGMEDGEISLRLLGATERVKPEYLKGFVFLGE